jgi:hypothetical protein
MGDEPIIEAIRAFLTPQLEPTEFVLEFDYNGKHYRTKFTASHKGPIIEVGNSCINMTFGYEFNKVLLLEFIGFIKANSPELACFEPLLQTNARNAPEPRTKAADVLQILKTKVGLAFPVDSPIIKINDGAEIPEKSEESSPTMISPFHLLRGGPAFYEKYGYRSDAITWLKEQIKTFKWGSFTPEQKTFLEPFVGPHEDAELLKDIMIAIPWEAELAFNNSNPRSLSYNVFRQFALQNGIPMEKSNQWQIQGIWSFTLIKEDPQWIAANKALVLTRFEIIKKGGRKRKAKKTRKAIKRK